MGGGGANSPESSKWPWAGAMASIASSSSNPMSIRRSTRARAAAPKAGSDTWATSHTLAGAVKRLGGCDLVICGEKTVDGDTGQVGPEMAEWLGMPHVSYVREIVELNGRLKALCDMNDGLHLAEAQLPVLITVTRRAYRPRYATPQRIFTAVNTKIERWSAEDLKDVASANHFGVKGSPTRVTKIVVPPVEGRKGQRLAGSPAEAVAALMQKLETGGVL